MHKNSYYLCKASVVFVISYFFAFPVWAADNPVIANGTTVNLNGNQPPGPPATTSNSTPALEAENNGVVNAGGTTVTTTGNGSYGVFSTTGGNITLNGGTVSTTGATDLGTGLVSWGLFASANGVINVNGTVINTIGAGAAGVVAGSGTNSPGTIHLSGANIITTGTQAQGVVAATGGAITLGGSSIQTSGTNAIGVLALGGSITGAANVTTTNTGSTAISAISGNITYTGGSINTQGSNSSAFSASSAGTISASGFGAQTTGSNAVGASATSGGSINLSGASLQTSGSGSSGALASGTSSNVTLSNMSLQTSNTNAAALVANSGGIVSLTGGSAITSGANSAGVSLSNGGTVNISNASVGVHGNGSYGLSVDNSAGSLTSTFNISNANLHSDNADQLHMDNASVNVNVTQASIQAGSTGVLVSAINGGTSNINGNNNANFFGLVNASNSNVNMSLTNNSQWTGSTSSMNDLTLDSSSTWNLNASSTIQGSTTLAGTIIINTPTPVQNTLTFNDALIGQNGKIIVNTTLDDDSAPSDIISIGNSSTGTTGITVNNYQGQGAPTDQGILLVTGVNSDSIGYGSFYLTNPTIAGPYEYVLVRDGNNLYLRNNSSPAPGPVTLPAIVPEEVPGLGGGGDGIGGGDIIDPPTVAPGTPLIPIYRPEVSLITAIPTSALLYDQALLGNLHQRRGETFYLNTPADGHRKWLRYIYNGGSLVNGSIYKNGTDFKYQNTIIQLGVDLYMARHEKYSYDGGFFVAVGSSYDRVNAPFVSTAGHNQLNGTSLGGYLTYQYQDRLYVDALLQGTHYGITADSYRLPSVSTNGMSFSGSLESGYRYPVSTVFSIQPQAQLIAQTLHINDAHDIAANIQFAGDNPVSGRLGLLGEFSNKVSVFDPLTLWVRGNYWHQFNNVTRTSFSFETGYIPFASPLPANVKEAEFGFSAKVFKRYSFFGTCSRSFSSNNQGAATTAILGVNIDV